MSVKRDVVVVSSSEIGPRFHIRRYQGVFYHFRSGKRVNGDAFLFDGSFLSRVMNQMCRQMREGEASQDDERRNAGRKEKATAGRRTERESEDGDKTTGHTQDVRIRRTEKVLSLDQWRAIV